jgi:hypothetical protein
MCRGLGDSGRSTVTAAGRGVWFSCVSMAAQMLQSKPVLTLHQYS